MTETGRPNVLLIMADQLAASWLPAYGHDAVQAPNLTALAAASTVYDAAYCPSPLCAPSRGALLAGRLPSRIGVYDNAAEMAASVPTLAHALRAEGYATALSGKMHFVGPDQLHGFEERLTPDVYPADLDWTPDWRRPLSHPLPWYHTMESVLTPGVTPASMQQDYDDEVAFHAVRKLYDLARTGGERPFFLTVSFTNPHDPWEIRAPYWDRYDRAAIEPPAVPRIPLEDADPHSRRLRAMYGTDEIELDDEQLVTARHGYYAAVSYVDDRIGEVLRTLREVGLDDSTAVIFTADHGEMLGERGLWYKMAFFEHAARVPLFVRPPGGGDARRVTDPVSTLDLVPTVFELTGVAADELELDGTSLLAAGPDRIVHAEYLAEGVTAPAVMVRRGRHKLIVCPGDPDQLYDLGADPHELENLAADPAHAGVRDELRAEVSARWDLEALDRAVLASQRERRLVVRGLTQGTFTAWDYSPPGDALPRYVRSRVDLYELQRRSRLEAPLPREEAT
jgi:choline-sulfatase